MRTMFVGRPDQTAIPNRLFLRFVIGALLAGGLTAACLGAAVAFLTSLAGAGTIVENIVDGLQVATLVFFVTVIAGSVLSIFPFGPVAYVVARYAYRRNLREVTTYAFLGAATTALLPGFFIIVALLAEGPRIIEATATVISLAYLAWFAISGAAGGMAFAKRLNRAERGENFADVF